jgi:flagellar basal-body rod protein FlgC
MDFDAAMKISAAGMKAQRAWMNVLSANLANINTTRTPSGKPYERRTIVYEATPAEEDFDHILDDLCSASLQSVRVVDVVADGRAFREVHDPGHPDANDEGVVALPNISSIEEMTNMVLATRSYEANLAALNNSKHMALKALEIGRS